MPVPFRMGKIKMLKVFVSVGRAGMDWQDNVDCSRTKNSEDLQYDVI